MTRKYIPDRSAFFDVLDLAIAEIDALATDAPGFPPYANIARQLAAMKKWTANGREPSPDERGSIDVGLVAMRELEPAQDDLTQLALHHLYELNGYFEDWPPDP